MPESDKSLPENSKQSLDQKLDHAIYETFPTSDPVSVQVTKGGAIDYDDAGNPISSPSEQNPSSSASEGLVEQAKEALGHVAEGATEMASNTYEQGRRYARDAYEQGRRYVRGTAERYPQAERYYEQSRQMVREYTPENPMVTLLLGAAIGYGMAWMIHHRGWREDQHVPDYARTRRRYRS
jgi:ElaB/YqjD/DUF883 family membrane-anchored ribosome-binding protein